MSTILYVILGLLIIILEVFRHRIRILDAIFFANVNYFMFFVITPLSLIIFPEWQSKVGLFRYENVDLDRLDLSIICLISYLGLWFGWFLGSINKPKPYNFFLSKKSERKLVTFGFISGIIGYLFYVISFGGIYNSIIYGSAIRYGRLDAAYIGVGAGEVFRHFIFSLNLVLLYNISKILFKEKISGVSRAQLWISGLLYLLYLLSASSRGAFVGLILSIFTIWTYKMYGKIYLSKIISQYWRLVFILPLIILFILYGKQFFWSLPSLLSSGLTPFLNDFLTIQEIRLGDDTNIFRDSILKEASHGLVSLSVSLETSQYLWFRDYWLLPLHIVPANLIGISVDLPATVSTINTYLIQGIEVSSSPPGILAMFVYNAGILGLIFMVLYGYLGRIIQRRFESLKRTASSSVLYFYFAYLYGGFIGNGDIKVYVYSAFPIFLLIIILYTRKLILKLQLNK